MIRAAVVLAGYAGVVGWLTWPLPLWATTHLPAPRAPFDAMYAAWALGWQSHALATSPWSLADGNIYYPTPRALFYGPLAQGALPFFAPTFLLSGNPTLALNVVLLGGLTLLAWSTHEVARRWTGSEWAGLAAAGTLLTNPWLVWGFVPSAPHWAMLACLPWIALLAARPRPAVALLAPLVVLQCLTDVAYVAPGVLVPLAVLVVIRLVRPDGRRAGGRLVVVLALAVMALVPLAYGFLRTRADNPTLLEQTYWHPEELAAARPLIDARDPAHRAARRALSDGPLDSLPPAVPLLVAAGALVALLGRPRLVAAPPAHAWWHGTLWALAGIALSRPWVAGAAIRAPERLGVPGMLGLALLAGCAVGAIEALLRSRLRSMARHAVIGGLVAALSCGSYLAHVGPLFRDGRFPVAEAPIVPVPIRDALAATPGPLLELPLGPLPESPAPHATAMYRSLYHWHAVLNGYASYWPAPFSARMALAARLPAPDALADLARTTDLELVWVHLDRLPPEARERWLQPDGSAPPGLRLLVQTPVDLLFQHPRS